MGDDARLGGGHWVAYLRPPGAQDHTGMVSLDRGCTSPAHGVTP